MQAVSKSEFAKMSGVSAGRISQLLASGQIPPSALEGTGRHARIIVDLAREALAARFDPAQHLANGKTRIGIDLLPAQYQEQRARRELYTAENAKLDFEERLGKLALASEVEHRQNTVFRKLRDRLLGIPSICAEQLVAAPDARAVRRVLDTEIRAILDQLAIDLDRMADGDEEEL